METKEEHQQNENKVGAQTDSSQHFVNRDEVADGEIDLVALFKEILKRRRVIFLALSIALALGFVIALTSPEEYTTEIRLMPQTADTKGSASNILQQIGGLSGINFGSASGAINPMLYPDITSSSPFYLSLINKPLYFPTLDTLMTLEHYFIEIDKPTFLDRLKKYTIGLPKMIIRLPIQLFSSDRNQGLPNNTQAIVDTINSYLQIVEVDEFSYKPITINPYQLTATSKLRNRIETEIEPNGILTVSSTMPDPAVAAKTTEMAVNYLTDYVVDYRVEKAQKDLDFIAKQYEEKKMRYVGAQQYLATMRDRNANLVTERGRVELERAETEYNLAFNLYQSVSQQLEQAKVRVQEETPVFKILEPIQIPLSPTKPNRELIIILSALVGVAIGTTIVILQIIYSKIRPQL